MTQQLYFQVLLYSCACQKCEKKNSARKKMGIFLYGKYCLSFRKANYSTFLKFGKEKTKYFWPKPHKNSLGVSHKKPCKFLRNVDTIWKYIQKKNFPIQIKIEAERLFRVISSSLFHQLCY